MNELGSLYTNGWGVAQDYTQARDWFVKAIAAGNIDAMFNMGVLYDQGWGVSAD
jgi:TPR repeat protein